MDTITLVTNPACQTLGRTTFAGLAGTDETGAAVAGEKLGVEAVDEYTLKLTFTSPTLPEEFLVDKNRDIYVLPTHLLQDIPPEELMTDDFWLAPVGSGPCQYVSEVSGSTLVLKSNQNYQLGAPGFDTLTITVMDKANLLTALIAGTWITTPSAAASPRRTGRWRRRRASPYRPGRFPAPSMS